MNVRMLYIPAHRFHKPSKRINPQIKLTNKQTNKKQQRKKKKVVDISKREFKKKKKKIRPTEVVLHCFHLKVQWSHCGALAVHLRMLFF